MNAEGGVIELHIDAPDGKLLGQTKFIGDDGGGFGSGGKPVSLPVTPTDGVHDIYLVFVNPKATPGNSLMIVMNTSFKTGDAPISAVAPKDGPKLNLDEYAGKYKMTGLPFPYIEVTVKDGKLMLKADQQEGALTPMNDADKFDADGKATLFFIRDDKKKVFRLQMEAMGFKFDGIKE